MIKCKNGAEPTIIFGTGASSFKDYDGLYSVIKACFENGIVGFDTAPSYGTEEILGKCLIQCMKEFGVPREDIFVQTKIDAVQMMDDEANITERVKSVIHKMGLEYLDALLIHWPVPEYLNKTWDAMIELQQEGFVRYIGICNFRMRQLEKIPEYTVLPQIIQIERNPLRICDREVEFCHRIGVTVQAYSPLCKMHEDIRTSDLLNNLAVKYNKNIGQIVLRWHIDTCVIPIFTSKKTSRVKEYAALSDFALCEDEIKAINSLNRDYKMYLESCACPGY